MSVCWTQLAGPRGDLCSGKEWMALRSLGCCPSPDFVIISVPHGLSVFPNVMLRWARVFNSPSCCWHVLAELIVSGPLHSPAPALEEWHRPTLAQPSIVQNAFFLQIQSQGLLIPDSWSSLGAPFLSKPTGVTAVKGLVIYFVGYR